MGEASQFIHRSMPDSVLLMAHVEAQSNGSRDDIAGVRLGLNLADRCYQTLSSASKTFHRQNKFRRTTKRIVAQVHRGCASVARFAGEDESQAGLTGNRGDHPKR